MYTVITYRGCRNVPICYLQKDINYLLQKFNQGNIQVLFIKTIKYNHIEHTPVTRELLTSIWSCVRRRGSLKYLCRAKGVAFGLFNSSRTHRPASEPMYATACIMICRNLPTRQRPPHREGIAEQQFSRQDSSSVLISSEQYRHCSPAALICAQWQRATVLGLCVDWCHPCRRREGDLGCYHKSALSALNTA